MKKLILAFMLFTGSIIGKDNFFQQSDKQMHMGAGAMVGLISAPIYHNELGMSTTQAYWAGVATSLLVGVGKELYDSRSGGTGFDTQDILATGLGGMGGASLVLFVYKF